MDCVHTYIAENIWEAEVSAHVFKEFGEMDQNHVQRNQNLYNIVKYFNPIISQLQLFKV